MTKGGLGLPKFLKKIIIIIIIIIGNILNNLKIFK